MDFFDVEKNIRNTAIAGAILAVITLIQGIFISDYYSIALSILISLMAIGIYFKSRVSAILLFLLFSGGKIMQLIYPEYYMQPINDFIIVLSGLLAIVFLFFLWMGVLGTFAYHKDNPGQGKLDRRVLIGLGISIIGTVAFFALSVMGYFEPNPIRQDNYLATWKNFKTHLVKLDKAEYYDSEVNSGAIKGLQTIQYESDGRKLNALLFTGNIDSTKRKPAIIYLHGGWSLGENDIMACSDFIAEDFIAFAPSYRGESGNPGNYEQCMGEIEDAKAAIRWFARQPYIDSTRIYVIGHSAGGIVSLALSLHPNLPIKMGASISGMYSPEEMQTFNAPYDINDKNESEIRSPLCYLKQMLRKHIVYVGTEDIQTVGMAKNVKKWYGEDIKLTMKEVSGNHFTCVEPAMNAFLDDVKREWNKQEDKTKVQNWMVTPFKNSPQVALTNKAFFKHSTWLSSASAFLVSYKNQVYAITAKHLIGSAGGVQPEIKPAKLNDEKVRWVLHPRTQPQHEVVIDQLLNTNDTISGDILIFSIKEKDNSLFAPPIRTNYILSGEKMYLIGCPYGETDCLQNQYAINYVGREGETLYFNNLSPNVELKGFSGAPVVDSLGRVIGVFAGTIRGEKGNFLYVNTTSCIKNVVK